MLLTVENNLTNLPSTLTSYLATNGTTGGTVLPVKNINGFQSGWAIQVGATGEETAEILNISGAPSGTVLNTSGTVRFPHSLDTPIFQTHYDSVVFLRNTAGTTSAPTALATVPITPDSFFTEYNDTSGVATYAYQTQFYNSVSGDLSGTSSWFIPGGPTFYSLQKLKDRIKHDLYSSQYIKDDNTIIDWVNEWLEIMTNSMIKVNQGYAMGTANYAFGTAGLGTVSDPLFKNPVKIELTWDGITYTNSREIPINGFTSTDIFSSLAPRHYWAGDTVFGILPAGAGTARMTNSLRYTPLANDSDELPQMMKGYTTSFIEYCLYKAYDLDQKKDQGDGHWQKAVAYQNAFISEITPRDQTGIKTIQLDDSLSGFEDDLGLINEYLL